MIHFTPEPRIPQAFRERLVNVLLRCVDLADSPADAKSMLLTMYESRWLTVAETFAEIASRGLESA